MRKIVGDIFAIFFKLTKSNIVSLVLTVSIVSVLSFFILHGVVLLTDGLMPTKALQVVFTGKIQYVLLLVLAAVITVMTMKLTKNTSRLNKKPDYLLVVFFILIAVLLVLYIRYADLLN